MTKEARSWLLREALFCGLLIYAFSPGYAFSQAPFYQGKTLTIVRGGPPGDTGDMRVRAVIPTLQKYIPGNPTIVVEYMPGGGGRKAANHLYGAAQPDGLTIANIGAGFVSSAILGLPGVQYDVDRVIYLGSGNSRTSYVLLTRREVGLDTIKKFRSASGIRIGAQSVGHDVYINGRLFAWLLGLKEAKFVTGYSGVEVDQGLLRGEVDARANITDTIPLRNPDWIEKGLVHFHAVLEIPRGFRLRHRAFEHLPELESFAGTDLEKKVLHMFRSFRLVGSPFILPPETPKERVAVLQEAFRKTFKDPEFMKTWKKLTGADAYPLMPEEQERTIREIPREHEVIALFNKIAGGGPLPSR